MIITSEKETSILEYIYKDDFVKQRDIAESAGISLGMANAVLKRLVEKGLLTVKQVNSRNIRYAVSPAGVEEILKRSYRCFRQTVADISFYRSEIEKAVEQGCGKVLLAGKSDLEFLVEYACVKRNIKFSVSDIYTGTEDNDTYVIVSEQSEKNSITGVCRLNDIIIKGNIK